MARADPAARPDRSLRVCGRNVSPASTGTQAGLGFTLLGARCGASSYLPAHLIRRMGSGPRFWLEQASWLLVFSSLSVAQGLSVYWVGAAAGGVGYKMMAPIPGAHVLAAAFSRRALALGVYFSFGFQGGVAGPWLVLDGMQASQQPWRFSGPPRSSSPL